MELRVACGGGSFNVPATKDDYEPDNRPATTPD